jgi:hypothetical protein
MNSTEQRDGFVIYKLDTGEETDFIACTKDGRMRERVEEGLAMRIDLERFYFGDTRDD